MGKRGPKPLPEGSLRNRTVAVRFLNSTYAVLEAAAKSAGFRSVSAYIRGLVHKDVNSRKEELGLGRTVSTGVSKPESVVELRVIADSQVRVGSDPFA